MTFWDKLPRPFVVMAPMADVTDPAFRALVAARGAPDVFWTEFVSADGLYHTREVKKMPDEENPLMRDLQFSKAEHPIVAQFFSSSPEAMAYAARLAEELGFDGVDVNMGCPDRAIERQGSGSAMIRTPEAARVVIRAMKATTALPVSVKTRVGYHKESLEDWLPVLFAENPAAVTLHLRTRRELSLVPADWDLMKKAVTVRNKVAPGIPLVGNGDVRDREDALAKIAEAGCEGAMIGRGMFGNPWVFAGRKSDEVSFTEKVAALVELARNFEKLRPKKSFSILKKHIKAFITGFDGASDLRVKLMAAQDAADLTKIITEAGLL